MPRVGFETTIPVFERAKAVHALDRAATVRGKDKHCSWQIRNWQNCSRVPEVGLPLQSFSQQNWMSCCEGDRFFTLWIQIKAVDASNQLQRRIHMENSNWRRILLFRLSHCFNLCLRKSINIPRRGRNLVNVVGHHRS
jgi:hypothetical protein